MKIVLAEKVSPATLAVFQQEPGWQIVTPDQIKNGLAAELADADALVVRSADGLLRRTRNLCLACLLEAVRDQTKCVDLKQVNRVLLQPHCKRPAGWHLTDGTCGLV